MLTSPQELVLMYAEYSRYCKDKRDYLRGANRKEGQPYNPVSMFEVLPGNVSVRPLLQQALENIYLIPNSKYRIVKNWL